jgi:predicted nucleotidyltransferase
MMQAIDWEEQFHSWSGPASVTEDQKRDRTENAIREAIEDSPELAGRAIRVFAKGSYKNNTNVRLDSDVDVAVEFQEGMYHDATDGVEGLSRSDLGLKPYSGSYPTERFKDDVERALVKQFGRQAVDRGNKAIHVRENSSSLSADVVPCFTYHRYYAIGYNSSPLYHEGIQIHPDSGGTVVNWPEQTYMNGTAKNNATGRRYKRMVRILKRLENEMVKEGIIEEVPSFLIECLVYNVPNSGFQHVTYRADVQYVLAHLFNGALDGGGPEEWVEVNGLKWLFHPTQKWTKAQAHGFLSEAWNYVDFE